MPHEQEFDLQAILSRIRECRLAGRFDEAQDYCRQILEHDPDNSEAHLLMCALFIEGGEYQEATSWYRKMERLKSFTNDSKHSTMVEKVFMGNMPGGMTGEPTLEETIDKFSRREEDRLPVSGEPAPAPPLVEEPAEPILAEPVVVPPLMEEPAEPILAEPVVVPPLMEEPAEPILAEPVVVPPPPEEPAEPILAEPIVVPLPPEEPAAPSATQPVSAATPKGRKTLPRPVITRVPSQRTERASRRPVWLSDIVILILFLLLLTGWQVYNLAKAHYSSGTRRPTETVSRTPVANQTEQQPSETSTPYEQPVPASNAPRDVERSIERILSALTGRRSNDSGAPVSSRGKQNGSIPVIEMPPSIPPIAKSEIQRAKMQVSSTPAGASVFLDGRDTGRQTPCALEIDLGQAKSGSVKVAMELAGFLREERTITVNADKPAEVKWTLSRAPYKVEVSSTPGGGDIYLDGRDTGHQTPYTLTIDAGDGPTKEVTIAIDLQNYARAQRKITLGNGGDTAISLSLGSPIKIPDVTPPPPTPTPTPTPTPVKQPAPNPALPPGTRAGEMRVNPNDGAAMAWVPAGEFLMGSASTDTKSLSEEKPQRRVTLDGYWIYQYEVTVAQFRAFTEDAGYAYNWDDRKPFWGWNDKHPMVNVTWNEARAYAVWAGVSLPTEAQWEKAARGTDGRIYPWGSAWSATKCNTSEKALRKTMPVGSYPAGAGPYGAQDMAGNVGEWCADWYGEYPKTTMARNPVGPATGKWRVLRGGSWRYLSDGARCASRDYGSVGFYWVNAGFRCAAVP